MSSLLAPIIAILQPLLNLMKGYTWSSLLALAVLVLLTATMGYPLVAVVLGAIMGLLLMWKAEHQGRLEQDQP
ncbi:hypothetical protein [Roseomonas marmotae]|uniref:Uncharacterized protein n=1 Tax=Roseomonas marmotae TaxID=2768161 RepID=A0ABS3KFW2_9PROT|nr:hypothetical protein [Roseomonas marmotae]MBO1075231.1 hypothetical protein [Roseomonas marmotae]QTI79663.1 hypothetical protein IAI58_02325 [Roseomonas marmotae]